MSSTISKVICKYQSILLCQAFRFFRCNPINDMVFNAVSKATSRTTSKTTKNNEVN